MIIRTSYVLLSAAATVFGARFSPIAAIADMDADRVQVAGILRGAHSNGLDVYNDYYLGVILDEFVGKLKIRRSYCMHRHAGWKPAQEDMVSCYNMPIDSQKNSKDDVSFNTFRDLASRHKGMVGHPRSLVTFEFPFTDTSLSKLSIHLQRPQSWPLQDDSSSLNGVETEEDDWRCTTADFSGDLLCLWAPAQDGSVDILGVAAELGQSGGPSTQHDLGITAQ